jgi:hypothetical protein
MVHVPSLSSVSMGTNCVGSPLITLSYHSEKKVTQISYKNWKDCEQDFNKIKCALAEVEELLNKIRLTENGVQLDNSLLAPEPVKPINQEVTNEIKRQFTNEEISLAIALDNEKKLQADAIQSA